MNTTVFLEFIGSVLLVYATLVHREQGVARFFIGLAGLILMIVGSF